MFPVLRRLDCYHVSFDHDGLICDAGLVVTATLMVRLGVEDLVTWWVRAGATQAVLPFRVMVHGHLKQGVAYGYTKQLGYHPLLATCAGTGEILFSRMTRAQRDHLAGWSVSSTNSLRSCTAPTPPARSRCVPIRGFGHGNCYAPWTVSACTGRLRRRRSSHQGSRGLREVDGRVRQAQLLRRHGPHRAKPVYPPAVADGPRRPQLPLVDPDLHQTGERLAAFAASRWIVGSRGCVADSNQGASSRDR